MHSMPQLSSPSKSLKPSAQLMMVRSGRILQTKLTFWSMTEPMGRLNDLINMLMHLSAEQIADSYKARWGIEVFFRWIKQNLNVPILFGTTKNAVFNQLFAALMTYVVLKWLYDHAKSFVLPCKSVPLIRFKEQIQYNQVHVEWIIAIGKVLEKHVYLSILNNLENG